MHRKTLTMDKVKGFMFPNAGGGAEADDGVAWWMKYASKAAGIVGGVGQYNMSLVIHMITRTYDRRREKRYYFIGQTSK